MHRVFAGNNLVICGTVALAFGVTLPSPGAAQNAEQSATTAGYIWHLPPGFPEPRVPLDNPMSEEKIELGCRLFFDTRLSVNNTMSCATCHQPQLAFTDGKTHSHGATQEALRRNAMSLTNVAYNPAFTWASGTQRTLEAQMETPLFGTHPVEMGLDRLTLKRGAALTGELGQDVAYKTAFASAFPNDAAPMSMRNVVKAIATFQRTLISGRSPFDRYVFDGDRTAMSASAVRGMALFYSPRAGCSQCHSGVNFSGDIARANNEPPQAFFANTGLYNVDGKGSYPSMDIGLKEESGKDRDMGRFRVPTLRNVALTRPYMHNGSVETLDEVIDHYAAGGRYSGARDPKTNGKNRYRDARIQPLELSDADKTDLVTFLVSLTDLEFVRQDFGHCQPGAAPTSAVAKR